MKTVMKKICCLLLVAVLMVGYLPFQAFAEEVTHSIDLHLTGGTEYDVDALFYEYGASIPGTLKTYWVHQLNTTDHGIGTTFTAVQDANYSLKVVVEEVSNPVCGHCGAAHETSACDRWLSCCNSLDTHASSCTVPCDGAAGCTWTGTHKDTCPCPTSGCTLKNGHEGNCTIPCSKSSQCTKGNGHAGECDAPCTKTEDCNKNNGHEGDCFIPCTTTGCTLALGHTEPHTVPCTTANCALNLGHTGDHKCSCNKALIKSSEHSTSCPYYELPYSHYTLKVYANLYVGGVENGTVLLDTIYNLSPSENVHDVITANKSRLEAKIGENSAYQWSGHFYKEKDTKTIIGTSAMTVEDTPEVYINLYRSEKSVVVRVHTSKSYVVDNSVEVHGFHVDDVITSKDVLRALQAKYNISSLKMYTTAQWDRVVQGKSATTIANHVVTEGDNIIHAYISGSSKTTSTAKADSSNYKTGDTIFTYVTVMVASVSCLAAVLYLKKKCAVK